MFLFEIRSLSLKSAPKNLFDGMFAVGINKCLLINSTNARRLAQKSSPEIKRKKETEVPASEEPDIVVSIVAMVVVVHVHAALIRIAKKNATTRRPTIFVQTHRWRH